MQHMVFFISVRTSHTSRLRTLFSPHWVTKDDVIRVLFSSISSSMGVLQLGAISGFGSVFLSEELLNLVTNVNLDFI